MAMKGNFRTVRRKNNTSEWSRQIVALRKRLGLSQAELGARLEYSPMAVSRWERGVQEPPPRGYIDLGRLAGNPGCIYFWERAGLRSEDLMSVMPVLRQRFQRSRFADFEIVAAGSGGKKKLQNKVALVAIPLLKVVAAAPGEKGDGKPELDDAPVESMIAAPKAWCPNPTTTSCLRVRGSSMSPLILDGYIVAVDSSQSDRAGLDGKIVIAWHRDLGLTVSRFRRYDHTEVLQPENQEYESISLSGKHQWKIVAKVLWWIGKAP